MTNPVTKWREAHANIDITDEALAVMAPFPSLFAGDFANYVQSKGYSDEVVHYLRDIQREIVWVYDCWQKAQRDGRPDLLLGDLLNNASGPAEYGVVQRFLRDYAKANNIRLGPADQQERAWHSIAPPGQASST